METERITLSSENGPIESVARGTAARHLTQLRQPRVRLKVTERQVRRMCSASANRVMLLWFSLDIRGRPSNRKLAARLRRSKVLYSRGSAAMRLRAHAGRRTT